MHHSSSSSSFIPQGHTGGVSSVAFSPDGKSIVSGSDDNTVKIWSSADGTCTSTLKVSGLMHAPSCDDELGVKREREGGGGTKGEQCDDVIDMT